MSKGQPTISAVTTNVTLGGPVAVAPNGTLLDRQSVGYMPTPWQESRTDADMPPWQRDPGFCDSINKSARGERRALLQTLVAQARAGVIVDDRLHVVEGTSGWVSQIGRLPALRLQAGQIKPVSVLSENDLTNSVARLLADQTMGPLSVLLRDLDGWGTDLLQMTKVGNANPRCVLVLLPKSLNDVGTVVASLGVTLGLTKKEVAIAVLVLEGRIDLEIASSFGIEPLAAKRAVASILGKFRVRRRSDLVRLFSRLP